METENKNKIYDLCLYLGLGKVIEEPTEVKGGLLHTMFKVTTDIGNYAIKCLNPSIMSRKYALNNMINCEKISEILGFYIPVINAKKIDDNHVHKYKDQFFIIYDWFDGKSIYPPEIKEDHCNAICDIIGKIHSLDSFSVSDEKGVVFEKCLGFRNRSEGLPNNRDTAFGIAFGTKLFTALAVCKLIDAEKLSLYDKLWRILPYDLGQIDKRVSVLHLLTHTSG